MRVLTLDIETAPNLAHTWGLWNVNVGLPQLLESGYVMCFAAKWEHEDKVRFHRGAPLVRAAHKLLDGADVVVGYNHVKFDLPWLQSEFVKAGAVPPSPFVTVDLCAVVKQQFRFPSNKLEYVAGELLGERKAPTGGHQLWVDCMAGKKQAWDRMRSYNEQDVRLTERLYHRLRPWVRNLPNPALYGDADVADMTCAACGSANIIRRGLAYTKLRAYQRYYCNECGRWQRGGRSVHGVDVR